MERVGDLIKREIGDIIERGLKDPRIGFVTITAVKISADLRHARVFFSVYGDDRAQEESRQGLESARFYIQGEIGRRLRLKYTPELSFLQDQSIAQGLHITKLIKRLQEDTDGEPTGGAGGH
jgi:ribosome-binding factor A